VGLGTGNGRLGTGNFENDDALDFVAELEREGPSAIDGALERVTALGPRQYLEAPEASAAIAASEVIAAVQDGQSRQLPEEARNWVAAEGAPNAAIARLAKQAQRAL